MNATRYNVSINDRQTVLNYAYFDGKYRYIDENDKSVHEFAVPLAVYEPDIPHIFGGKKYIIKSKPPKDSGKK